ncbi:HPP family protein [Flavobacterium sp. FZUC8N2.13]|uniref:HPP family protein n=1 Tax=Flavobacterium zubiriense TaxID=3138075 RepID=A0ABV4TES2_9FLAO
MLDYKIKRGVRKTRYILYRETLINYKEQFWSFVGSFIGIGLIAYSQSQQFLKQDIVYLIGSFGASSVLVYGIIESPFSQPRNLIGGHLISAFTGVTIHILLPDTMYLAAPLAVSLSIVFMQITKTLHPPGGATALIAIISSNKITDLGYWYLLYPVLTGVLILLFTALIFNNVTASRNYPLPHYSYNRYLKNLKKFLNRDL